MENKAVFLDRDGTLNIDPGYIGDPAQLVLFPFTIDALSVLKKLSYKLIVISNQSGIARGLVTTEQVESVNSELIKKLSEADIKLNGIYYCPHHPDFSSVDNSECRKPLPYMINRAANDHNIDLKLSYMIGDSVSDIECGINAEVKTILVKTGNGKDSISILQKENKFPTFVADNILDACKFIENETRGVN